MITVYKYTLGNHNPISEIAMPKGAEILTMQVQGLFACIWARVDTSAATETRTFTTYGTGNPMPENAGKYIGTYQVAGGTFVFHVFETI